MPASPHPAESSRLHYIDNMRAFVMSIGVLVHAGEIHHFWLAWLIHFSSGIFRMKLFVLIAGYFVALLKERRGYSALTRERLIRFGVPALVAVVLLNPVANFFYLNTYVGPISAAEFLKTPLVYNRAGFAWGDHAPIFLSWHLQIWFIITVLIFCLTMKLGFYLEDAKLFKIWSGALISLDARHGFGAAGLAITLAIVAVAMRAGHFLTTQQLLGGGPFNFLAQTCWLYAPYFILGIAAYRSNELFSLLHRLRWAEMLGALVFLVIGTYLKASAVRLAGFAAGEVVEYFVEGIAGAYLIIAIFAFFRRFANTANSKARYLSEASYTIYLFQMAVLAPLQFWLLNVGMSRLANYFVSIAVAYGVLLLIHKFVVDTNPITRLVFNGKPWWKIVS